MFKSRSSTLVHEFSFVMEESKTKNSESKDEDNQLLNTTITHGCTFSNSGKLLAAFSDGKALVVFRTDDWKQIGKRFENNGLYVGFTGQQDLFEQAFRTQRGCLIIAVSQGLQTRASSSGYVSS